MAEMNNIEKLIQRLRLCNTFQANDIIYELIDILSIDCKYIEKFKYEIKNIKYPHWTNLYKIISSYIRLYKLDNYEYYSMHGISIIDAIKNRMKFEDDISHVLPLECRNLSAYFSNYNEYRYQSRIMKLVRCIVEGECVKDQYNKIIVQQDEDIIVDKNILINTVRWLYRIVERKVYDEGNLRYRKLMSYLQALHASILINVKYNISSHYEIFVDFVCVISVGDL